MASVLADAQVHEHSMRAKSSRVDVRELQNQGGLNEFVFQINEWGKLRIPFLFLVDFELQKPIAIKLSDIDTSEILYDFNGISNSSEVIKITDIELQKSPMSFDQYQGKFDLVMSHLKYGDSFLTNLTIKTEVKINYILQDLFFATSAKYKLWWKDEFLFFSPEIFIQIKDQRIFSYPMKGTIDAAIINAEEIILKDEKELAEHITIVDLIRNDISKVATNVKVNRFRYIDHINTGNKTLLQVSSEIEGKLQENYLSKLGDIIVSLLPAGSVSGAPKNKTLEVIRNVEGEARGYYTGVCGYFDGESLDSGVMIRFIEQQNSNLFYRSGGGITVRSKAEKEYQETIDKIYVPIN